MLDSDTLMIDPSILVSANADKGIQSSFGRFGAGTDEGSIYVSSAFKHVVEESEDYSEDATFNFFIGRLSPKNLVPYPELKSLLESYEIFDADQIESSSYDIHYSAVREVYRDRYPSTTKGKLADVLYDEFVFLAERSQVPSRTQKSPDTDIDGVRTFSLSEEEVDELLQQAPGNYVQQLRSRKRRTGWNYITTMGGFETLYSTDDPFGQALISLGLAPGLLAIKYGP